MCGSGMIMAVKEDCGKIGGPQECAGCGKKIHDKFLLKVGYKEHWRILRPLLGDISLMPVFYLAVSGEAGL